MAKSVNRVTLLGNLGQDPEMRSTQSNISVCTLRIATSESYKDKSGEWQERTDWHNVVLWDKLADIAGQYLSKGSQVYIEGRLQTRNYEAQDGTTKYITEVVGRTMIMLGGRDHSSGDSGSKDFSEPKKTDSNVISGDDFDDEVPF